MNPLAALMASLTNASAAGGAGDRNAAASENGLFAQLLNSDGQGAQTEQALPAGLVSGLSGAEAKLSGLLLQPEEAHGDASATGTKETLSGLLFRHMQHEGLQGEAGAELLARLAAAPGASGVETEGETASPAVLTVPPGRLAEALGIDPALIAQQSAETRQTADESLAAGAGNAAQLAALLQLNPEVSLTPPSAGTEQPQAADMASAEETETLAAVVMTPDMLSPSESRGLDLALLRAGDGSGGKGLEIALIRAGQAQGQAGAQQPAPANAAAVANAAGAMNVAGGAHPAADASANPGARAQAEIGLLPQQTAKPAAGADGKPQQNVDLPKPGKSGKAQTPPLNNATGGRSDAVQTIRILKPPASPASSGATQQQITYRSNGEAGGITPLDSGAGGIQQRAAAAPSASQGTPQQSQTPAQSLAVHIAQQARDGTRRFDIRLEPPELGRVEVRLDVSKSGQVTTHLVVERSETLDLLQRDSRTLERALQDAGLDTAEEGLKFSLKDHGEAHDGEREEDGRNAASETDAGDNTEDRDDPQTSSQPYIASSALDIRI